MNKYDTSAIPYLFVAKDSSIVKSYSGDLIFKRHMDGNISIIESETAKVLDEINHEESLDLVNWILNTRP
jgi:hypothetical protein